jgi:tRNA uridine 5-carbamoylmethylation protein Kti12
MQLIIIRGLPGSGKTTLANQICSSIQSNNSLWEADMYFEQDGEYKFNKMKIREAHEWCQKNVDHDLNLGFTVVVANTFTTKKELRPYFDLAKKHCIVPQVILCQGDWGSIHNVPMETIESMKIRFEYNIQSLYQVLA